MDLTPEQIEKIKRFVWSDEEDDENALPQPQMATCDEMLECAERVAEYVVEHLNLFDLQQDVYSVNVPIETHPLLAARYDKQWTEYSRSRVFDFLRAIFIQKIADLGYIEQLETRIREVFPRSCVNIEIWSIDFFDEPEVDVSVTEREVSLTDNTEEVTNTRSYRCSGNTITVELKIKIKEAEAVELQELDLNLNNLLEPPEGFPRNFIV